MLCRYRGVRAVADRRIDAARVRMRDAVQAESVSVSMSMSKR